MSKALKEREWAAEGGAGRRELPEEGAPASGKSHGEQSCGGSGHDGSVLLVLQSGEDDRKGRFEAGRHPVPILKFSGQDTSPDGDVPSPRGGGGSCPGDDLGDSVLDGLVQ